MYLDFFFFKLLFSGFFWWQDDCNGFRDVSTHELVYLARIMGYVDWLKTGLHVPLLKTWVEGTK